MYPYLAEIGPVTIGSFGVMVALAFVSALLVLKAEFRRQGIETELAESLITGAMIGGLVGAKLYYVLFETPQEYTWRQTLDVLFSGSGVTFYGGFAVAAVVVIVIIRRRGVPIAPVADAIGMALALAYAVGRIGCQLAGDGDYGGPTDLPWAMAYPDGVVPTVELVHPAPVYETIMGLAIFSLLWATRRSISTPGFSFCLYLVLSGVARFAVEFVRINPPVAGSLTGAQLISLCLILVGCGLGYSLLRGWGAGAPRHA
jgi:phosphatidylglycerol:prolipoprotein diacylglycerol transferase